VPSFFSFFFSFFFFVFVCFVLFFGGLFERYSRFDFSYLCLAVKPELLNLELITEAHVLLVYIGFDYICSLLYGLPSIKEKG
jgi:hypothetical protein